MLFAQVIPSPTLSITDVIPLRKTAIAKQYKHFTKEAHIQVSSHWRVHGQMLTR